MTSETSTEKKKKLRYRFEKVIGQGSYAEVYLAEDLKRKEMVAVKVPRKKSHAFIAAAIEVKILRLVQDCPGCIPLLRCLRLRHKKGHVLAPVMPVMKGTLLSDWASRQLYLWEPALATIRQLIASLAALAKLSIAHGDLKPENIMFDDRGRTMLIDFGLAHVYDGTSNFELVLQSARYRAPEVVVQASALYGPAMDMWSLGCIVVEMLTGKPIFATKSSMMTEHVAHLGPYPSVLQKEGDDDKSTSNGSLERFLQERVPRPRLHATGCLCSQERHALLCDLIGQMLEMDPERRITAEKAHEHPLFDEPVV